MGGRKKEGELRQPVTLDPEIKCYLPGVPRATYLPFPFQIIQSQTNLAIVYEYRSANRSKLARLIGSERRTGAPAAMLVPRRTAAMPG